MNDNNGLFNPDERAQLLNKIFDLESALSELRNEMVQLHDKEKVLKRENEDFEKLRPSKTFGIAVSGDVLLNRMEVEIVDTAVFQRLRKVRQLGSTYLVYPSAVHTRFEHSLGVLKQADEIIRNIRNNRHSVEGECKITPEEEQIVRLLALLHDIGHMPFGHTIEDEFGIFRSHDKHETRWQYFLGVHSEIGRIIIEHRGEEFHKLFFALIKCEKQFTQNNLGNYAYLYDIVSNTVCADLLDYLNRDCFYTNLKLTYHPRFLNYYFIGTKKILDDKNSVVSTERRIGIRVFKTNLELRRDIISELIQLLRNRYYIGERVYYHHAKIMTGTLLAGSVVRAKSVNGFDPIIIKDENMRRSIEGNDDKTNDRVLYNIHLMGDEDLVNYLINLRTKFKKETDPQKLARINGAIKLATAFDQRIKYKEIISRTKTGQFGLGIEDEFDTERINKGQQAKNHIANVLHSRMIAYGTAEERLNIEDNICDYLGMESGDVLVYCPNFNMAMKLAKALIEDEKQELIPLMDFPEKSVQQECKSIIENHQSLWALRVFLHPKYYDESDNLNMLRIELIQKYFNWLLFSHNEKEEYDNGFQFWEDYFEYYFEFAEATQGKLQLDGIEKRKRKKELAKEFIAMTHGNRIFKRVEEKISEKFYH